MTTDPVYGRACACDRRHKVDRYSAKASHATARAVRHAVPNGRPPRSRFPRLNPWRWFSPLARGSAHDVFC